MSKEKYFESKLRKAVERMGGMAHKLQSQVYTGMPDRLVLMPHGKTYLVEFKDVNGALTARQTLVHKELNSLGHRAFIVNSHETLLEVIETIRGEQ